MAEHEAKDKTVRNNKELTKLNAVSTLELEISEAEAKKPLRPSAWQRSMCAVVISRRHFPAVSWR